MEANDITIEILKGIRTSIDGVRDEVRATNVRVDALREDLSAEIRATNARVDELRERVVTAEIHVATELVAVSGAIQEMRDDLRQDRALRHRVDDCERRIGALEGRAEP